VSPPSPPTNLCLCPLFLGSVSGVVDEEGSLKTTGAGRTCCMTHTFQQGEENLREGGREGEREGGREGGREGEKEGGKEGSKEGSSDNHVICPYDLVHVL